VAFGLLELLSDSTIRPGSDFGTSDRLPAAVGLPLDQQQPC
jgi:hypothetical protein